jgi:NAD(P)-dependent dehydrogenase (short-subunit alcohol dehydrogenase family)
LTTVQAGIFEPSWSNFWDDETSGSYKTIRINVDHPIKFTRLAMRALAGAEKQGVVVLVASTAGIRANYLASLYTASKHAIVGFAKAMGQADSEEGVKINAILPGLVGTNLWHDREDNMMQWGKFKDRKKLVPEGG